MYTTDEKIIMWLSSFEFMSYKKAMFIIEEFNDLEDFFYNLNKYKSIITKVFELEEYNQMISENHFNYIDRVINNYEKLNIEVLTIKSDGYPELLKEISSPPVMLYCMGDISLLNSDCLAVVGTRRISRYGKEVGSKIVKEIAHNHITIVSGLADGVDTMAHKSCLEVGGKTIAVLGGGLLNVYPKTNQTLFQNIIDNGGLVISEYKPNEPSRTFQFPIRNRIIAGISKATFVVEATEKSGSMHTKNFALDYGREVFAMPARIGDIYSVACNKIIQSGQGQMVLGAEDILRFFGINEEYQKQEKVLQLTCDEQMIYDYLQGQERHFDEILSSTGMQSKTLLPLLMRLEINGIIIKLPGNYYKITI